MFLARTAAAGGDDVCVSSMNVWTRRDVDREYKRDSRRISFFVIERHLYIKIYISL